MTHRGYFRITNSHFRNQIGYKNSYPIHSRQTFSEIHLYFYTDSQFARGAGESGKDSDTFFDDQEKKQLCENSCENFDQNLNV